MTNNLKINKMTIKKHDLHTGHRNPSLHTSTAQPLHHWRQAISISQNKQIPNQTQSKDTEKHSIYETNK